MYDAQIGKRLYQRAHEERRKLTRFNYLQGITHTMDINDKNYECNENQYIQYLVQAVAFDEPSAANELASLLESAAIVMENHGDGFREKAKECREKFRRLQKANVNKNSASNKHSIATSSSALLHDKSSAIKYNHSLNNSPAKTAQSSKSSECRIM